MNYRRLVPFGLFCLVIANPNAATPTSHFPANDLGRFLAERFDLATIRSSLGPRRAPTLRTFADFQMSPSKATDDVLEFESTDWFYQLRIVGRRDVNGDGIEDLEVDDIAKHAPRELATRASRLAQKFDVILKAQARVPDAEIDAILRQAADMSASIAAWRRSIGQ